MYFFDYAWFWLCWVLIVDPRQISRSKRSSKHIVQEATRPGRTELTTDRGEGRTVVCPGAHGRASSAPFFFSSSFAAVHFPARFSVLSCYFVLKRGVYLALLMGWIHRKLSFILKKLHWRRRRKKKSVEAKAVFLVANWKIGTQALHKLSYLLCFLSFSSIIGRISEFCLVW